MITAAEAEPWISPGGAAILSGVVLLLGGLIVAIVELRKTRVAQVSTAEKVTTVEHQVQKNTGGSLRDAVDRSTAATVRIGQKFDRLHDMVHEMDKRLTRVETRTEWIAPPPTPRSVPNGE